MEKIRLDGILIVSKYPLSLVFPLWILGGMMLTLYFSLQLENTV